MDLNQFLPPLPPPPFASATKIALDTVNVLRPARRQTVPEWAEENCRIETPNYRGKWNNDFAPYMTEPSQATTDRRFGGVIFVGPARTAKTSALILNTIGHRIDCMPRKVMVVAMTEASASEFSIEKLDGFLNTNKSLLARILKERNSNTKYAKRFQGGMRLTIRWPVIGHLSMADIPDVLLTDYDRMPLDISGEGNAFDLSRKRNQQYGTLGKTIAESSPGFPIIDDDWRPQSPHEAPPCPGILSLFNRGTRGKYYWNCPSCKDPFQPLTKYLECAETGSAGERAKTVEMVCPNCGTCIAPDRKNELNRAGRFLHETNDGELVEFDSPKIRETDVASFWCEGPVAAMQEWSEIKFRQFQAEEEFEVTGDEQSLKTTVNVDQGRPYKPKALTVGESLSRDGLMALANPYELKVAPPQTRFITVHVDVQGNRFVVGVDAWGVGLERWLIDRFDIVSPPKDAPGSGDRAIDPARYQEDWEPLFDLLSKPYQIDGTEYRLLPRALAVDMQGKKGVTDKAYQFYYDALRKGLGHRLFLYRGEGGWKRERAVVREPDKIKGKKSKKKTQLKVLFSGTDRLKDEVTNSLTRKENGPGKYHLPEKLPANIFDEFCAEHRLSEGWRAKKSGLRNESLDHAVIGKALIIAIDGERIDWDAPPAWAKIPEENTYTLLSDTDSQSQADPVNKPKRGRRVRSKGI